MAVAYVVCLAAF